MAFPYDSSFKDALTALRREGRYRVFADIHASARRVSQSGVPSAIRPVPMAGGRPIMVWCSNDYLNMGQHPKVLAAMHEAIDAVGAGSGGTRKISGTSRYHVELEKEAGRSPRQGSGPAVHFGLRLQ